MIRLDEYLRARRTVIDRALNRYIRPPRGKPQTLWRAMRYGVFPGGKRLRPILTLAAGELFHGNQKDLLPFACAVEMIHAYSLIHDDLPALDNDDLRRGAPSAHKAFGEGMALLAGDALLTAAFHVISSPPVSQALKADLVLDLIHELAHAASVSGLVGGQAFELEAETRDADIATVEYIHVRKTGALILAAVRLGARVAGAKPQDLSRVSRYGEFLGLAFQIADDIVDHEGEKRDGRVVIGRSEWKKATYPAVVGVVQAKERLQDLLQQAHKQLSSFGAAAEPLRLIADSVGAPALGAHAKAISEEMHP
jgi:geranylgeranyl diphosphate synthase type II